MKQEMMGWHCHQLDHMQIMCTLLQTNYQTTTSSLKFLWAGCKCQSWINGVCNLHISSKAVCIICSRNLNNSNVQSLARHEYQHHADAKSHTVHQKGSVCYIIWTQFWVKNGKKKGKWYMEQKGWKPLLYKKHCLQLWGAQMVNK